MTLDEIRLQQLLSPFNNQNTGVMSTNSALPFINTGQVNKNLQNTDLVNQIIQENQMKANVFSRPNMMNVAGDIVPSGITTVAPLQNLGIDTSYGVANEPDEEQVEYLQGQEPSGIAKLFEFLGKIPTPFNLARRGLESLSGFNQRIRSTPFAQSKNLAEYFNKRREAKEREAISNVYKDARDRGTLGPGGGFSTAGTPKGETMGDFSGSTRTSRGRQDY